jgi:dynein assembly factor 1
MDMTKEALKKLCKENSLYNTPHINDRLYLHYKGFKSIENLDEYTGLKCLWLEGNGFLKIEGLNKCTQLKTLYLHENIIEVIECLDNLVDLDNINLSKNFIRKIEGLTHNKKLTTLNLANNHLSTYDGIVELLNYPSLQTVDLQHNRIDDPAVVDIFAQMSNLRVLYLLGNPCVKQIKHYRKTVISRCKDLRYLDDRPVFDDERRRVDAWAAAFNAEGGNLDLANEAERLEIKQIRKEKDEKDEHNFKAFELMMKEGQEIRRVREAAEAAERVANGEDPKEITDYTPGEVNKFSGEEIIPVPESDEVRKLREARWKSVEQDVTKRTAISTVNDTKDKQSTNTPIVSDSSKDIFTDIDSLQGNIPEPPVNNWKKMTITEEIDDDDDDDKIDPPVPPIQSKITPPPPPPSNNIDSTDLCELD